MIKRIDLHESYLRNIYFKDSMTHLLYVCICLKLAFIVLSYFCSRFVNLVALEYQYISPVTMDHTMSTSEYTDMEIIRQSRRACVCFSQVGYLKLI